MKTQEFKFTLGNGSEQEVKAASLSAMLANLPLGEKLGMQKRVVEERGRSKKVVEGPADPVDESKPTVEQVAMFEKLSPEDAKELANLIKERDVRRKEIEGMKLKEKELEDALKISLQKDKEDHEKRLKEDEELRKVSPATADLVSVLGASNVEASMKALEENKLSELEIKKADIEKIIPEDLPFRKIPVYYDDWSSATLKEHIEPGDGQMKELEAALLNKEFTLEEFGHVFDQRGFRLGIDDDEMRTMYHNRPDNTTRDKGDNSKDYFSGVMYHNWMLKAMLYWADGKRNGTTTRDLRSFLDDTHKEILELENNTAPEKDTPEDKDTKIETPKTTEEYRKALIENESFFHSEDKKHYNLLSNTSFEDSMKFKNLSKQEAIEEMVKAFAKVENKIESGEVKFFGNKNNKIFEGELSNGSGAKFKVFNIKGDQAEFEYCGEAINENYFENVASIQNDVSDNLSLKKEVITVKPGTVTKNSEGKWEVKTPASIKFIG